MSTRTVLPYGEYLLLPEDDRTKYEMLWGELFMAPAPRFSHQEVQVQLGGILNQHVRMRGMGRIVGPVDLYRDELNYVQPDLSYFRAEQVPLIQDAQAIRLIPPLVVEILSPSTADKDRHEKRRWYTELGVREYWLVDLVGQQIEVIDLETNVGLVEDPVRSMVLPELVLPVAEVFG